MFCGSDKRKIQKKIMFDYRKHVLKKIIKKNNFEREKLILNDKNIKSK
jgi:hypothetical protein